MNQEQLKQNSRTIIAFMKNHELRGWLAAIQNNADENNEIFKVDENSGSIFSVIELTAEMEYDNVDLENQGSPEDVKIQQFNYLVFNNLYDKQVILDWVKGISWEYSEQQLILIFTEVQDLFPAV